MSRWDMWGGTGWPRGWGGEGVGWPIRPEGENQDDPPRFWADSPQSQQVLCKLLNSVDFELPVEKPIQHGKEGK